MITVCDFNLSGHLGNRVVIYIVYKIHFHHRGHQEMRPSKNGRISIHSWFLTQKTAAENGMIVFTQIPKIDHRHHANKVVQNNSLLHRNIFKKIYHVQFFVGHQKSRRSLFWHEKWQFFMHQGYTHWNKNWWRHQKNKTFFFENLRQPSCSTDDCRYIY